MNRDVETELWLAIDEGLLPREEAAALREEAQRLGRTQQRLTLIVLTNRAGGEPWTLAQYLADPWLGPPANPGSTWPFVTVPNAH